MENAKRVEGKHLAVELSTYTRKVYERHKNEINIPFKKSWNIKKEQPKHEHIFEQYTITKGKISVVVELKESGSRNPVWEVRDVYSDFSMISMLDGEKLISAIDRTLYFKKVAQSPIYIQYLYLFQTIVEVLWYWIKNPSKILRKTYITVYVNSDS